MRLSTLIIGGFLAVAFVCIGTAIYRLVVPPAPSVLDLLGVTVQWQPRQDLVTVRQGTLSMEFYPGRRAGFLGERLVPMDAPMLIIDGRPMVPLGVIAEMVGARTDWDAQKKSVSITTGTEKPPRGRSHPSQPRRTLHGLHWLSDLTVRVNGDPMALGSIPVLVNGRLLIPVPGSAPGPPVLVAIAGYSLLCAILLILSRGAHRAVMLIASISLLLAFVMRAVILAIDPALFVFRTSILLEHTNLGLPLGFLSAGTAAYWIGGRLVAGHIEAWDRHAPHPPSLQAYRAQTIGLGLVMAATALLINLLRSRWMSSPLAFATRLPAVDLLLFVVMYLAVDDWAAFNRWARWASGTFLLLILASELAIGSRTAPFLPLLAWLTAISLRRRDPSLSWRWIVAGLIATLIILPPLMALISIIRDLVRDPGQLSAFRSMSVFQIWLSADHSIWGTLRLFSDRFPGFDVLTVVMNREPAGGVGSYMTGTTLLKSFAAGLVPDSLVKIDAHATGSLFAVGYQEYRSLDVAHYGAWTGFGFFYAFLKPAAGLLGMAVLGAATTWTIARMVRGTPLLAMWTPAVLYNLGFLGLVSGNFDLILSGLLVQIVSSAALLWAIGHVGGGVRPRRQPRQTVGGVLEGRG